MSQERVSPKLKQAMAQIRAVLAEHDIAGNVHLFNGEGHSEYMFHIFDQSWSALTSDKEGIRFTAAMKTGGPEAKVRGEKTINMLCIMRDLSAMTFNMADGLLAKIKQYCEIEETPGVHTPHEGDEN